VERAPRRKCADRATPHRSPHWTQFPIPSPRSVSPVHLQPPGRIRGHQRRGALGRGPGVSDAGFAERRESSVALTSTLHWFETDVLPEKRNYPTPARPARRHPELVADESAAAAQDGRGGWSGTLGTSPYSSRKVT